MIQERTIQWLFLALRSSTSARGHLSWSPWFPSSFSPLSSSQWSTTFTGPSRREKANTRGSTWSCLSLTPRWWQNRIRKRVMTDGTITGEMIGAMEMKSSRILLCYHSHRVFLLEDLLLDDSVKKVGKISAFTLLFFLFCFRGVYTLVQDARRIWVQLVRKFVECCFLHV